MKSKLALRGRMTDSGGRRMSETKEVTTVVKAWARLRDMRISFGRNRFLI